MWLPKEERRLLMFYAAYDRDFRGVATTFSIDELQWLTTKPRKIAKCAGELRKKRDDGISRANHAGCPDSGLTERCLSWLKAKATIESANNRLRERGLVDHRECGTGQYEITMRLAGWDVGNKYNRWWSRTHLWFAHYKDHWVWLIVSFLGGVLGALLVQWLSD